MIREPVVNGIEAAELTPVERPQIIVGYREVETVRKLHIWNTGPGMTANELLEIADLVSSVRKQNSLDQNFGMGAKVALLPPNRHGLRYRSCMMSRNCPIAQDMTVALEHAHCLDMSGGEEETVRRIAAEVAECCLAKRVARALVYNLAKKVLAWRPEEVTHAQASESLSFVADDWAVMMDMARQKLRDALALQFSGGLAAHTVAA